jgi:hypothetical protein
MLSYNSGGYRSSQVPFRRRLCVLHFADNTREPAMSTYLITGASRGKFPVFCPCS